MNILKKMSLQIFNKKNCIMKLKKYQIKKLFLKPTNLNRIIKLKSIQNLLYYIKFNGKATLKVSTIIC